MAKLWYLATAENVNGCMLVARYLPTGMIDTTFGTNGFTTISFTGLGDYGYSGAIQADGKLIVAGTVDDDSYMGFARLTSQGLLDPSFGSGGKITTSMPGVPYGVNFQTGWQNHSRGLGWQWIQPRNGIALYNQWSFRSIICPRWCFAYISRDNLYCFGH